MAVSSTTTTTSTTGPWRSRVSVVRHCSSRGLAHHTGFVFASTALAYVSGHHPALLDVKTFMLTPPRDNCDGDCETETDKVTASGRLSGGVCSACTSKKLASSGNTQPKDSRPDSCTIDCQKTECRGGNCSGTTCQSQCGAKCGYVCGACTTQ